MKLFLFSLISVLFVIALADTKTCVGSRCKRMTEVMANLYNDYDYGYGGGNGGTGNGSGGNGGGGNEGGRYGGGGNGGGGNGGGGNGGGGNGGGFNNNQNRESDCPNCYARDFGNGDYSHNTINIEKK